MAQNNDVNTKNFSQLSDIKRVSVAGACPYWSPVLPARYELGGKSFVNANKRKYLGLKDTEFIFIKELLDANFMSSLIFILIRMR